MSRLQDLKTRTEAGSYAEVIKNALRLYEAVVTETQAGASFQVVSPDGERKAYVIF
jgi:hypothetical protein